MDKTKISSLTELTFEAPYITREAIEFSVQTQTLKREMVAMDNFVGQ